MNIYNWDLVCAASCKELNKRLKQSVIDNFKTFSWSDNRGNAIEGQFGDWEICSGGDSQRINILTPISLGKLKATILGQKIDVNVDGICPKLQIELAFVKSNNGMHLRFNMLKLSNDRVSARVGNGAVVIIDEDVNNVFPEGEDYIPLMFCELLVTMLIELKDKINFVFAEVLALSSSHELAWMKPHLLQYAYCEKQDGELGSLAVLMILKDRQNPPSLSDLQLIFDSSLIRNEGSVGFMLSEKVFMENVILPGLVDVFKGSLISQYHLDDNLTIKNSGKVTLEKINGYTPHFNNLEMKILDDRVVLNNTYGTCDVVSGSSYVSFSLSASYIPRLSVNNEKSIIKMESVNSPVLTSEGHDTAAKIFWIFGGWTVDALVQGIRSQMSTLLFEFSSQSMKFDIYPVSFNIDVNYSKCGLENQFFMQN